MIRTWRGLDDKSKGPTLWIYRYYLAVLMVAILNALSDLEALGLSNCLFHDKDMIHLKGLVDYFK